MNSSRFSGHNFIAYELDDLLGIIDCTVSTTEQSTPVSSRQHVRRSQNAKLAETENARGTHIFKQQSIEVYLGDKSSVLSYMG